MPPAMADYRVKARRRMKRGLHPSVVAAADAVSGSSGVRRTNTTGNARSGQQFVTLNENGHTVHLYDSGQRIGVAPKHTGGMLAPDDANTGQRKIAPPSPLGSGPGLRRPPEGTGQRDEARLQALNQAQQAAQNAQVTVGRPVSGGPGRIVQTNYDKEAAALVNLAKAKRGLKVPETPMGRAPLVHELLRKGLSPGRRRRRRGVAGY